MKKIICLITVLSLASFIGTNSKASAQENPFSADTLAPAGLSDLMVDAAQPDAKIWQPLNDKPVKEYTPYYEKRTIILDGNDGTPIQMTYFILSPTIDTATATPDAGQTPATTEGETQPPAAGEEEAPDQTKYPLVVLLHGVDGFAEAGYYLLLESVRKPHPSYVIIPALPRNMRWADPGRLSPTQHAIPQLIQLVEKIKASHPIDPARIYVNGCDMGGIGAFGAAQLYPDTFAAAVPVGATWSPKETSNMHKTALAAFHGTNDQMYSHYNSSDTITMSQQQGGVAYFTLFENMKHECGSPSIYTPQFWDWLYSQKKG
ncbi:MAG: hypothetical protein ACK4NR_06600 [Micavibrio sp.]